MDDAYQLYSLLKESFLLLDFGDRQLFEQYGLTVPRYYALYHIAMSPGTSPSQLSNLMFCDKSNITRLLQSLEADGMIERQSHEYDGRVQRIYLTKLGAALQSRVGTAHNDFVQKRLSSLPSDDRDHLTKSLGRLNHTLTVASNKRGANVADLMAGLV